MTTGPVWVKLFYQTLDSDFWLGSDEPFDWRSAFLHVLMNANWKPGLTKKYGHMLKVNRGQWLTSVRHLAKTFGWSRKRVENWLDGMEKYGMLKVKSVGWGTLLTVVKYDVYQTYGAKGVATGVATVEAKGVATGELRSKSIDTEGEKEESKSPADAGMPSAETSVELDQPADLSEWYAAHANDEWEDEE